MVSCLCLFSFPSPLDLRDNTQQDHLTCRFAQEKAVTSSTHVSKISRVIPRSVGKKLASER